jgi:hypothetical protein
MLVPTTHGQSRYLGVLAGKECKAHQQSVGLGSLFLLLVFFQARDIACKC